MQFMSFPFQGMDPVTNIPANSAATHPLIYRGATYQISPQRVSRAAQQQARLARLAQLVGQQLIYRGTTSEIVPPSAPETIAPKTMHRLIYRGTTYLKAV